MEPKQQRTIVPGRRYKIKKENQYFTRKYRSESPIVEICGSVEAIFGENWQTTAMSEPIKNRYWNRMGDDHIPDGGRVFVGRVLPYPVAGELVHETELGEEVTA